MDFRIGKRVRAGRASTKLNLDFYNLFNISTTQAYNESFGPAWLNANTIMTGRLMKVSVQFDF